MSGNDRMRLGYSLGILVAIAMTLMALVSSYQLVGKVFPGFRVEPTLTVSAANDPSWNGARAHLQQYDRIIAVEGDAVRTRPEMLSLVRAIPLGAEVHYRMMRGGKLTRFDVPAQVFTLGDWLKSFVPLIVIGMLPLIVGAVAFFMKPQSTASQVHLLMTLAMSAYFSAGNEYDAQGWLARVYVLSIALLGSTFLHLGLVFPSPLRWVERKPWMVWLAYAPAVLLAGAWEAIYRPAGMVGHPFFELHMNLQDASYAWVMLGLFGLIGLILFRAFKSVTVLERQQARVAVLGAGLAFLPGTLLWIVPQLAGIPLDNSGMLVNLAYACFVFFPLSIAYAIVRHKMFDIDLIIKRTVVYATVVAMLAGLYFLVLAGARWALDALFHAGSSDAGNLAATAVVALAFVPIRNRVQALLDRIFFRKAYDFRAVVSSFGQFAKERPELDAVVQQFMTLAEEALHPRHVSLMVREPRTRVLEVYREVGESLVPEAFTLTPDALGPATLRAFAPVPGLAGVVHSIPLEIKGELLGLIHVGGRRSDLDYSSEDQLLLQNMGAQLAAIIRINEMTKAEVNRARLDAELEVARNIQASLLPEAVAAPEGLQVAGSSTSALEFGGDYYDLVNLPDGQLRVVVGDVAGKGVQAAMVMAMTKSCFYNQVRHEAELPSVMKALNAMIVETIPDKKHRKTTLIYAAIDPAARKLRYACAGHQPPHYFNAATQAVEDLPIPGSFPFGASKLAKYEAVEVELHPGDVLVFYTDGVTEAQNPEGRMFYEIDEGSEGQAIVHDQLAKLLMAHHEASAEELRALLVQAVDNWVAGGPQGDDITLVVVKVA